MQIGDVVYAVGNPLGFEGTFSQGIISAIRELESRQIIQITAPISPGSSGGPILNNKGQVIGMLVSTIEGGQNINFAIPSKDIKELLHQKRVPMTLDREILVQDTNYNDIGWSYYLRNFYNKSIFYLTKAIEEDPENTFAYYGRGNAYKSINRADKAITDFTKSIDLIGDKYFWLEGSVYSARGDAYLSNKEYEKAIQDYEKAREIGLSIFDSIRLTINLAKAYIESGYDENAMRVYDDSIAFHSEDFVGIAYIYVERGKLFWEREQREKAFEDFSKAIKIAPEDIQLYLNRGEFYIREEKFGEATEDYSKVLEIDPNNGAALSNRGLCWKLLGNYSRAISDYTRKLEIYPYDAYSYCDRGDVYRIIGAYQQAIQDYEKYLELDPGGYFAEEVRERIQSLRQR